MNRIEVDTRLFITCRLCLEDLGVYQIAPSVQEQILYCFDINVEPFDGLPQLICKKCEEILTKFATIKKKFKEKQNDLRSKVPGFSNGQLTISNKNSSENHESRDKDISITTADDTCSSESETNDTIKRKENTRYKKISWEKNYIKNYLCRVCNMRWTTVASLQGHIRARHANLRKKYSSVFKKHCEVKLNKIDDKLNVTGSENKVVYSKDKIIQNFDQDYYITYTSRDYEDEMDDDDNRDLFRNSVNSKYNDSSDSDSEILAKRKRKMRLYSRSSNETVILDSANKSTTSDNVKESRNEQVESVEECIKIDSSDSETEKEIKDINVTKSGEALNSRRNSLSPDDVTINDIVNICLRKYTKKHYNDDHNMVSSSKKSSELAKTLKRKVLSIGRKVITKKKEVNCTPLLRFMESKPLDIVWMPRSIASVDQDSNYIRINARIKYIGENLDSETGWSDYSTFEAATTATNLIATTSQTPDKSKSSDKNQTLVKNQTNAKCFDNALDSDKDNNKFKNLMDALTKDHPTVSKQISTESMHTNIQGAIFDDSAVLYNDGSDTRKLLNANPVANPKQLPKKCTADAKSGNQGNVILTNQTPSIDESGQEHDFDICMPIITSTTSLAAPLTIAETAVSKHNGQASEAPRIKVKPVSELMSAESLNRLQEPNGSPTPQTSVQKESKFVNIYVPQLNVSYIPKPVVNVVLPGNNGSCLTALNTEFMILDTVELPNTKTDSPFQYFKRLLQLHNIILLDADVSLPSGFHCLIKFKVLYKQENHNQPVILCLSLHCSNNVFCLRVKDRNQENINLSKISPNWQWEVLKIYKGEVVSKLLNNARKISQAIYEFTNSFLCLLKSINLIKQ